MEPRPKCLVQHAGSLTMRSNTVLRTVRGRCCIGFRGVTSCLQGLVVPACLHRPQLTGTEFGIGSELRGVPHVFNDQDLQRRQAIVLALIIDFVSGGFSLRGDHKGLREGVAQSSGQDVSKRIEIHCSFGRETLWMFNGW